MNFLNFVRIWLPAIVVAIGVLLWAVNPSTTTAEGSAHIVGAGIAIWILNVLVRFGIKGDRDRHEEEDARAFFDRHGHWPGEEPAARPRRRGRRVTPPTDGPTSSRTRA